MNRYFKTALFMAVIVAIACYSKSISNEVVQSYSECISFMANNARGGYFSL